MYTVFLSPLLSSDQSLGPESVPLSIFRTTWMRIKAPILVMNMFVSGSVFTLPASNCRILSASWHLLTKYGVYVVALNAPILFREETARAVLCRCGIIHTSLRSSVLFLHANLRLKILWRQADPLRMDRSNC